MKYDIDQSGRIEETNRYTIIAIANKDYYYTLKINSDIKRQIQRIFIKQKRPKMFSIYGFCAGIIILIKESKIKNSVVSIDIEYDGYNKIIKEILISRLGRNIEFRFSNIGKQSFAHKYAYLTFKKKLKPCYIVNRFELENLMLKIKP